MMKPQEIWKKFAGLPRRPDSSASRRMIDFGIWVRRPFGGPCPKIFYDHGDHIWGQALPAPPEWRDGDRLVEI